MFLSGTSYRIRWRENARKLDALDSLKREKEARIGVQKTHDSLAEEFERLREELTVANHMAVGDCTYWLPVNTGIVPGAGTHSRISVVLGGSKGESVEIPDLKKWGIMTSGHVYFQNGISDAFKGTGPCTCVQRSM